MLVTNNRRYKVFGHLLLDQIYKFDVFGEIDDLIATVLYLLSESPKLVSLFGMI